MGEREIRYGPNFQKCVKSLEKKHKGFEATIVGFLGDLARKGPASTSDKLIGVKGKPVYKDRIALPGMGKSGGARVIYYCNETLIVPLYVYSKNKRESVPADEIAVSLDDLLSPDENT